MTHWRNLMQKFLTRQRELSRGWYSARRSIHTLLFDAWDIDRLPKSSTGYKPIVVRIEYDIHEPTGGLRFMLPDEEYQTKRSPHMYTYCGPFKGLCDGACTWMPCRDTLQDACTFRIEPTVPDLCVAACRWLKISYTRTLCDPALEWLRTDHLSALCPIRRV